MKLHSLEDLFHYLLSDIYEVENQIIKNVPVLVKRAHSKELKDALNTHLSETKEQVKRLDRIFKLINKKPESVEWSGDIKNLFSDADTFLIENEPSVMLDAAIIVIAQRIEHFEIATYRALRQFAKELDHDEVEDILDETIKEEGHADKLLTKLAKGGFFSSGINAKAAK